MAAFTKLVQVGTIVGDELNDAAKTLAEWVKMGNEFQTQLDTFRNGATENFQEARRGMAAVLQEAKDNIQTSVHQAISAIFKTSEAAEDRIANISKVEHLLKNNDNFLMTS